MGNGRLKLFAMLHVEAVYLVIWIHAFRAIIGNLWIYCLIIVVLVFVLILIFWRLQVGLIFARIVISNVNYVWVLRLTVQLVLHHTFITIWHAILHVLKQHIPLMLQTI